MPRASPQRSDAAAIEIVDFQSTYNPGDIILGNVVTKRAFAQGGHADESWVTLNLFGRAKTKVTSRSGNSTRIYRGRAVLFEEEQCIFRGAVIADATLPFAITIPNTSETGFEQRGDSWDRDRHDLVEAKHGGLDFLSSTEEDVTKHQLPPVYYFKDWSGWSGNKYEAYIEYALEARLHNPHAGTITSVFPLIVRATSTDQPIRGSDYDFHIGDSPKTIRSERLLPENSERELTFREVSRRFFTPWKTPRFSYRVKVVHPSVIQLEHPEPLPFKVYVVPDLRGDMTTIDHGGDIRRLPIVEFKSIDLKLVSHARIRAKTTFSTTVHDRRSEHTINLQNQNHFGSYVFNVPIVIRGTLKAKDNSPEVPSGLADERDTLSLATTVVSPYLEPDMLRPAEDDALVPDGPTEYAQFRPDEKGEYFLGAPFDLGSHLDIRLSQTGASTFDGTQVPLEQQVFPSFNTYNIVLSYQLVWVVRLLCAGENHVVEGIGNVKVLAPSEEQEQRKKRELGHDGMKKNYDDLMAGLDLAVAGLELAADIIGAFG